MYRSGACRGTLIYTDGGAAARHVWQQLHQQRRDGIGVEPRRGQWGQLECSVRDVIGPRKRTNGRVRGVWPDLKRWRPCMAFG
ncbi:hypothetical protein M0R45_023909 [Rubus argutus]|uniref:MHC class I antigen n=1 Tax=Rubus argutus TaxID=59490 RepID=A0AAW1WRH9_RUBAR